ncbi:MAG TPA: polysaccharide deacetylase family protein [Thermoanaerobaculia bacterium]|nr:polysaccharide deacetylase family protein [Thermoanaerobaculia bacterium]
MAAQAPRMPAPDRGALASSPGRKAGRETDRETDRETGPEIGRSTGRPAGWRPTPFLAASGLLHAAGLLAFAAVPRQWPWITGTLLADHCIIALAGLLPRASWLGENLCQLGSEAAGRGEVALTFDDGPDAEVTPQVLDLLTERGVRATFFLVGHRAAALPELTSEIARRGHRIENHTWSHPNTFAFYPPPVLAREILRAQEVLTELAAAPPRLFRAPAGIRSLFLDPLLVRHGLTLASWTRRGYDTLDHDPRRVAGRLLGGVAAGDVLLLHDGPTVARAAGGRPVVLEALARVLDGLAGRGLFPVPFTAPEAGVE